MADHNGILDHIADFFVPIHRDGQKFVAVALVTTFVLFLIWGPLGWLAAIVTAWVAYIFRDPDRVGWIARHTKWASMRQKSVRKPKAAVEGSAVARRVSPLDRCLRLTCVEI